MLTLSILYGLQWLWLRIQGESDHPHRAANLLMDRIETSIDWLARIFRLNRRPS